MRAYTWRRRPAKKWQYAGGTYEVIEGDTPAGEVKLFGKTGAVSVWRGVGYSFRAGGADPMMRVSFDRALAHDVTVLDLARQTTVADYIVTPAYRRLCIADDVLYDWSRSFLTRKAFWHRDARIAVTFTAPLVRGRGEIAVEETVSERDEAILVPFGLYLAVSGRG